MFHVLALCAGNASRSILAEAILNRDGAGRIQAWSAGVNPVGLVNRNVVDLLHRRGASVGHLRSKNWLEFTGKGAPRLDLILNLCPTVSESIAPDWNGNPLFVDWHLEDPGAAPDDQINLAILHAYHRLSARINALLALQFERLAKDDLNARLVAMGEG